MDILSTFLFKIIIASVAGMKGCAEWDGSDLTTLERAESET